MKIQLPYGHDHDGPRLLVTNVGIFMFIRVMYFIAYHSRGGYLTITESLVTPLPDIYSQAAKEIGMKIVDVNSEDQIGTF